MDVSFNSNGVERKKQMPAGEFFDLLLDEEDEAGIAQVPSAVHSFGLPGTLARRRAAMTGPPAEGPADDGGMIPSQEEKKPADANVLAQTEGEKTPVAVSEKPEEVVAGPEITAETEKPKGTELDEFVTFGPDGAAKGEQVVDVVPEKFDRPVAPETPQIPPKTKDHIVIPKIQSGDNAIRVEEARGTDNDTGAEKEPKTVEPTVEPAETPVVTVDQTPNSATEEATLPPKPPQPKQNQNPVAEVTTHSSFPRRRESTISGSPDLASPSEDDRVSERSLAETLPPADDNKYAVPIRVEAAQNASDEETEGQTVYPANEQRTAETPANEDNGVDGPIAEIRKRMEGGSAEFDQNVVKDHAESVKTAIAPAPEVHGEQVPASPEVEVTVDGGGKLEPKAEDMADGKDVGYPEMARNVKGNEKSGYFARLTRKLRGEKPTAEKLPKAA